MIRIEETSNSAGSKPVSHLLFLVILVVLLACADNQNNFVPYAKVDTYISLVNYNNLMIPGNSMTFPSLGYAGLIVICISDGQYIAYDACCPYEGLKNSIVETNPGQTGIVPSSNPVATCKICKSQYILYNGGYPVKGPSNRNLKQYNVTVLDNRLWVHN
jgi:nitrite reductase/ring-hydroxylating ferredoxin subunit